jgi:type II secretory pathway component PulF
MKRFRYTAVTRNGAKVRGELEAASREIALTSLRKLGHLPVEVREQAAEGAWAGRLSLTAAGRPSSRQVTQLTHDLSMLLKAGMTLDRALAMLERDSASHALGRLTGRIRAQIGNGKTFHEALQAQAGVFPPIYASMVRVAEASGTLNSVLGRIADGRRRAEKLRSKAMSAILYPALLIVMALAIVVLMMTFVVPRFKQLLLHAGSDVPASTLNIIAVSDWLVANGMIVLAVLAALVASLVVMWHQPVARGVMDAALARLPVVGSFIRMNVTIRFCRTLGTLLENGVDLPAAIRLLRDAVGHLPASRDLDQAYESLRKGRSFIEPLAASGLLPRVAINMLRVGDETGDLAQAALNVADIYEDRLETAVQRTFTILEPVIILAVSVFVAMLLMSILSAVISINDLAI